MPQQAVQPVAFRLATAARTAVVWEPHALVFDTTTALLYVGDGVTAGGVALQYQLPANLPRTARNFKTGSNLYYPCQLSGSATAPTLANGTLMAAPVLFQQAVTVAALLVEVTVIGNAGSILRMGIYADAAGGAYPGALVLDAGTVAADVIGVKELSCSQALAAGLYWFACAVQLSTTQVPTVRTLSGTILADVGNTLPANLANNQACYFHTGVLSGGLPTPFTAAPASSTVMPRLFMKLT